jgi:hypothetical protein
MLLPLLQHTGLLPLLLLLQPQLQFMLQHQHQLQSELTDLLLLQLLPLMLALINPNIFVFMSYCPIYVLNKTTILITFN